jgi:hypothetical protein
MLLYDHVLRYNEYLNCYNTEIVSAIKENHMKKLDVINMKHCFLLGVVCFSFSFLPVSSAFSTTKTTDEAVVDEKKLDFKVNLSRETFVSQSIEYDEEPFGDKNLAYKVLLPKSWTQVSDEKLEKSLKNKRLLGEVARYISPPISDDRATFSIKALSMTRLMDVEHWFLHQMSVQGLYVSGIKVFSRDLVHAEYDIFENERYYSIRAVAQRNGGRVILSEYRTPLSQKEKYKNMQRWTMSTLRLSKIVKSLDDLVDSYSYLGKVQHYYPSGWSSSSGSSSSSDEISAGFGRTLIVDLGSGKKSEKIDRAKGYIQTYLISKSSTPDINKKLELLMASYNGVTVDTAHVLSEIERTGSNKEGTVVFSPIKTYGLMGNEEAVGYEGEYAFLSSYNETGSHYFVAFMLMPKKGFNYPLWAENMATYHLLLRSLDLGI